MTMTIDAQETKSLQIRNLNDLLRTTIRAESKAQTQLQSLFLAGKGIGGVVLITDSINKLPDAMKAAIFEKVRGYKDFTEDNDLYSEHGFGTFTHDGHGLTWQIDYYDPTLLGLSDEPADPEKTLRVLTIMLSHRL